MRKAKVYVHDRHAGFFEEIERQKKYQFYYVKNYDGPPVSLTFPVKESTYEFNSFPAFFDGLLPEGPQLEGLLKKRKIDKDDYFSQILTVGSDLVGAVSVEGVDD